MGKKPRKKAIPKKALAVPRAGRVVPRRALALHEVRGRRPVWRFLMVDMQGRWGWGGLSREQLLVIHRKMMEFERLTWEQILDHSGKKRTGSHYIPRTDLSTDAQGRLAQLKLDDFDELCSLRVTGRQRIWGVIFDDAFHAIWWDPQHEVYPVNIADN